MTPTDKRAAMREIRSRFPSFTSAVIADAEATARYRGERDEFRSRLDAAVQALRLCAVTDAFVGQVLYRAKASMQAAGIPLLPRIAHRLAILTSQISVGDPVIVGPGVYFVHGGVVIDGITEIETGVVIAPWVTIGLRSGDWRGPTIERHVHIGTGAKVIGPVRVGEGAQIGANAVVVDDVAPGAVAVGAPARALQPADALTS